MWLKVVPVASGREVMAWCQQGRPFIVTSQKAGDDPTQIRLGLALPGRQRFAVQTARDTIMKAEPPVTLMSAGEAAPRSWQAAIEWLLHHGPLALAVYGSLAWQYHTGIGYITATSDLDLLASPATRAELLTLCDLLAGYDAVWGQPRFDGEIMLPDGSAVAWREWAGSGETVLTKAHDGPDLRSRAALMGLFP